MKSETDYFWANIGNPCPVKPGTRIELLEMSWDPDPILAGTLGTVLDGNGSQLFVKWDNGRSLHLLIGVDKYREV